MVSSICNIVGHKNEPTKIAFVLECGPVSTSTNPFVIRCGTKRTDTTAVVMEWGIKTDRIFAWARSSGGAAHGDVDVGRKLPQQHSAPAIG